MGLFDKSRGKAAYRGQFGRRLASATRRTTFGQPLQDRRHGARLLQAFLSSPVEWPTRKPYGLFLPAAAYYLEIDGPDATLSSNLRAL